MFGVIVYVKLFLCCCSLVVEFFVFVVGDDCSVDCVVCDVDCCVYYV